MHRNMPNLNAHFSYMVKLRSRTREITYSDLKPRSFGKCWGNSMERYNAGLILQQFVNNKVALRAFSIIVNFFVLQPFPTPKVLRPKKLAKRKKDTPKSTPAVIHR